MLGPSLPEQPFAQQILSRLPTMKSRAMKNGPKSGKTIEWTEVSRKELKKNTDSGIIYSPRKIFIRNGLDQIREEIRAGLSALELPFTPRWVSGNERIEHIVINKLKNHPSISFIVRMTTEYDRHMKLELQFRGCKS